MYKTHVLVHKKSEINIIYAKEWNDGLSLAHDALRQEYLNSSEWKAEFSVKITPKTVLLILSGKKRPFKQVMKTVEITPNTVILAPEMGEITLWTVLITPEAGKTRHIIAMCILAWKHWREGGYWSIWV